MEHTLKKLEKSQVEFTITVPAADYKEDMEQAAGRLSERAAIKGFRPGKAPYDMVKQQVGEIKIMEEAMQSIVQKNFLAATKKEGLETIGMPQITIEKIAPGNEFVFKATVALLPKVKLADLSKIKVSSKKIEVGDKEVNEVLENLAKMQRKEVIKDKVLTKDDKATIDMEMFLDKVPVEGGQAKGHAVYLGEDHYIPGLNEELVGLKKGDSKEFALKFPAEHYQKHLAGRKVDFKIKVNDVYELESPELNDDFAKTLGKDSLAELKELLQKNLTTEAENKEGQRLEIEIFDKMIADSRFDDIPEVLVNAEKNKMFHELKHRLGQQGIEMEQYLKDLKKTEEQIYQDFDADATKRVKSALISRQVASENDLKAEPADIDKEINLIKQAYPGDETVEENLQKPEVRDTLAITVQNRKVVKWLKDKVLSVE